MELFLILAPLHFFGARQLLSLELSPLPFRKTWAANLSWRSHISWVPSFFWLAHRIICRVFWSMNSPALFSPAKHLQWASSACCLLLKKLKLPLRCIHLKTFFFHKQTLSELSSLLPPPHNLCSFKEGKLSTSKIKILISVSYLTELYMITKEGEVQNKHIR